jgi:DNA-directed RNA polymerase
MSQIINEQVFILFPSLNNIYNYFLNITKIMAILNIPMTWITPAGLKITQHYLRSIKNYVVFRFGGKVRKLIIKEWTNKLDKKKQSQAIIPNIIHSLEATHLINLINYVDDQNFMPVVTVHDCFGTLPKKMVDLEYLVKK